MHMISNDRAGYTFYPASYLCNSHLLFILLSNGNLFYKYILPFNWYHITRLSCSCSLDVAMTRDGHYVTINSNSHTSSEVCMSFNVCTHWIVLGSLWLLYLCDGVILWWYFTALLYLTLLFPGTSCKLFLCWTWTRSGKGSSSLLLLPYGPRPQSVLHSVQWWWLLQSNMLWIW